MDGKEIVIIDEAMWSVELNIPCPKCEGYFDYLETDEYKADGFESLKHVQSDREANIKVKCPECGSMLIVKETSY